MKKVLLTKAGLHAWGLFLVAVLCLLLRTPIQAQTVQSTQYQFPSCSGVRVIVRESDAGVPVMYYKSPTGVHFMYGDFSSGAVKNFSIKDTVMVGSNIISYMINDMRVVGDMCYFCGVRMHDHGEFDPETGALVVDSIGILGRFRLGVSSFVVPVSYDIKFFSEVKSLNRMTTYAILGDTMIAMTGIVDTPYSAYSASCLVVARVRHTSDPRPWQYNVIHANNVLDEVFTDIVVDTRYAVVASYRRLSGEEYSFYLRSAKKDDVLFDDDYSGFDNRYKYCMSDSCIRIARPDNADVRLSAVPWDKKVYAAFACSINACCDSACNTALCEINTNNMSLKCMQIVQKIYNTAHTLMDTKYIYKTSGDASGAFVALLHQPQGTYGTVVEYPCALTSSYTGVIPTALVQRMVGYRMLSMSALGGSVDNIRFGGLVRSRADLTYLQEVLPAMSSNNLCMQNSETDVMIVNRSQHPDGNNYPLVPLNSMKNLEWVTKHPAPTTSEVDNICIYNQ